MTLSYSSNKFYSSNLQDSSFLNLFFLFPNIHLEILNKFYTCIVVTIETFSTLYPRS